MKDLNSDAFKIAKIDGPNGEFGIAFAGTTKEGLYYLYNDDKHRFFFFSQFEFKPICTVAVESTSGIRVSSAEEEILKANIEYFFKARFYLDPEQEPKPGTAAQTVTFTWGVVSP